MKTLLIATDFSPAAHKAFEYAMHMAQALRSRVLCLHVFQPPMSEPYMDFGLQTTLMEQQEKRARERFDEWFQALPFEAREDVQVQFRVELGFPAENILRVAREIHPDLIVMGMRGGNPIVRKLLGSTTTSLLQRAEYPVLVVPEHADYHGFTHIGYATDYEEDDIRVIDEVLYFARKNNAKLSCVHVRGGDEAQEDFKEELLKRAYYYDLTHDHIDFRTVSSPDVVEGLQHFVQRKELDLLVMLTHQRSRLSQMFHKSHSKEMALYSQIPLWVYPMTQAVSVSS